MTAEEEDAKSSKAEAGHRREELELITGHKESEEGPEAKAKDMDVPSTPVWHEKCRVLA